MQVKKLFETISTLFDDTLQLCTFALGGRRVRVRNCVAGTPQNGHRHLLDRPNAPY